MRVVIAPDSFKGSATASDAANAIADGWSAARPNDELVIMPQADGGECALAALATTILGSRLRTTGRIAGPRRTTVEGVWLELPGGGAVVELAAVCGLPLYEPKDALGALTFALGEVIRAVTKEGVTSIVVALGGSASTDGGTGALTALGIKFLDGNGNPLRPGGGSLEQLVTVDRSDLLAPPLGGVLLLTDVTAPLLGQTGAAAVYGPQKGATNAEVDLLERGLGRLSSALGGAPNVVGAGAVGGTAYGLATGWGAEVVGGAAAVASLTGLPAAIACSDVLITGEGQFDETSLAGKAVGHALGLNGQAGLRRLVIAGRLICEPPEAVGLSLEAIAGSSAEAMANTLHWLQSASSLAARAV